MAEEFNHIHNQHSSDGIDLNKLQAVARTNIIWIILIFILTNSVAYLFVRYTKDLYESSSEIKLDIKQEATDFGFRDFAQDQDLKMISGEIENIQSKLFLNNVIDSLNLHVSYYSIGQLLNYELYLASPFQVEFVILNDRYYNMPFFIEPVNGNQYELSVNEERVIKGTFNEPLKLEGITLTIRKKNTPFQNNIRYSFVINSRDVLLDNLRSNLTVEPLNLNANTIRVAFKDNNPAKARDLVNGIDSLYLMYSNEQKNRANRQKIEWLTNELNQIEKKMESFENYFENFTLENKTSNLNDDLKKTITQINQIDSQRYELSRKLGDINKLAAGLSSQEPSLQATQRTTLPEFINKQLESLLQIYLEMDRMKLSYNENTFAYRQKENEIQTITNKILSQIQELKASYLQKMADLTNSKAKLEKAFIEMPDKSTQYTKNQRYYKLYEEFYLTLMQNKSEFEIAQAGSTPDFKILSTATMPGKPISPNKPMVIGVGFVAGIVFNVFFIGILYLLNNKITSQYELERFAKVPVLGSVPALRKAAYETDLHILDHPRSMVSEAIRTLRTNLDFFNTTSKQKIIAISSTVSGEGKSFIAKNLGAVIAMSQKKVVLLDLDMRKQKMGIHNADQSKGISTILIRKNTWQDCVIQTQQKNLDYIPAGPQPPNPSELLLNGEFRGLLEELKKEYDFIIMDTPPVGLVTDGIMAMKHADVSIYIFRANYSKKEFLNSLQRIVTINKFSNLTSILNAIPVALNNYGYGYYEESKKSRSITSIFKRSV
jgi:tyrosine-protein kinase Etk/Wzc